MELTIDTPIQYLGFVGPSRTQALERLGIATIEDLLYHMPHRYNDYSLVTPINRAQPNETVTIKATVEKISTFRTKTGRQMIQATIVDETSKMSVVWFNQTYLLRAISQGDEMSFSGKVQWFGNKIVLSNPTFEILSSKKEGDTLHTGRLVAVYPETEGITSKWLRNRIHFLLERLDSLVTDELPQRLKDQEKLMDLTQALNTIHFPERLEDVEAAKKRLGFDELLFYQLRSRIKKREWEEGHHAASIAIIPADQERFFKILPFNLTNDQRQAFEHIALDLNRPIPMNRLLIGDVGSGKTIVAAYALYASYCAGFSSVLMAPTQILAEQHYQTIAKLLKPLKIHPDLITGATKTIQEGSQDIANIFTGTTTKIVVGTHAILTNQERFGKLGVVVIDEQHRFGVKQRGVLTEDKGNMTPHLLTMTATPIPRTLAKTVFGNLDVSFLLESPKGRQQIKTWLVPNEKRVKGYAWIREQIKTTDNQVFIICPLIDTSETLTTVKAVTQEFEELKKIFPEFSIGLLHGRMKAKDKTAILDAFRDKKHQILLATPVVEVGIDIPNATIIVIEAAERFGLSQLHQLRGRVGRSTKQSYCLLYTEATEDLTRLRLKALETIYNGPELAELDLTLRGAGDIFGTRQHGIPLLRVARLTDQELLSSTAKAAEMILKTDPEVLTFPILSEKLKKAKIEEQIQD